MSWFSRLRNAVDPGRLDDELVAEMRDHLERRIESLVDAGFTPAQARQRAESHFGNVTRLREQSRDIRLWPTLESSIQDMRHAIRQLRKSPVFAATVILSLAFAIGANTAIFSVVDAALLRPLPVSQPERLFSLAAPGINDPGSATTGETESFSYPMYQQFKSAVADSARLALFSFPGGADVRIGSNDNAIDRVTRQYVSGEAFEVLGVGPAVGRVFTNDDDRSPVAHPVVVLSHDYWRRRFQGDPAIVGRTLTIDTARYTVVGVAQAGFFGVEPGKFVDLWQPAMMYSARALKNPGWQWLRILGRLHPAAGREQIQARLQAPFHDFQKLRVQFIPTMPETIRRQFLDATIRVHPAAAGVSDFRRAFQTPLWIVSGVACGILLIACANVAGLLLARSRSRAAEMALRVSLGAAKSRLFRQLVTESAVLALIAGAAGWLIASYAAPLLIAVLSRADDPIRFALATDTRMLFFCLAISVCALVLFGLLPAWQASTTQPAQVLRGASGPAGRMWLGRFFVSVQVAFAFSLVLVGAAFLLSLKHLNQVNTGFNARDVTVFRIANPSAGKTKEAQRQWMYELRESVAAQSGIQGAALAPHAIFEGDGWSEQILLPSRTPSEREETIYPVSPEYFSVLKTALMSGRNFEWRDAAAPQSQPVIVNQAFTERYCAGENPLGKQFQYPSGKIPNVVIGVVANARYADLRKPMQPIVYIPFDGADNFTLYVRSTLPLGSVAKIVERETTAGGAGAQVREITMLDTLIGNTIRRERLLAGIGGAFAVLGLLLAAIGLFGLLNYLVERRTKEIGIRSALGARQDQIVRLILGEVIITVSLGLVAGLAVSLSAMRMVIALLFEMRPVEPAVLAIAIGVFAMAALTASALPALRAGSIDPLVALRCD